MVGAESCLLVDIICHLSKFNPNYFKIQNSE